MKYKFLGSSPDSKRNIKFMGMVDFEVGIPVEVTNLEVLDKLKTHKFFELVDDGTPKDVMDVDLEVKVIPTPVSISNEDNPKYQDMTKAIAAAGKKPLSRSKDDVIAAYKEL